MFKALLLNQQDKQTTAEITTVDDAQLSAGEVTVRVAYSSLNYKDGLAITGAGKVVRQFPMVPGIDFAGVVEHSEDDRYQVGDNVILTGWGVGEQHWGGIAEKARVKADWLVPMPENFDARKAMIIGTAGLTAMLCVNALKEQGITPDSGDIVVTGASGGVGSVAVQLLSLLGYSVTAVSGRLDKNEAWLRELGATAVIDRQTLAERGRPLDKSRWAGAIDTVGSQPLANILAQMNYGGVVAACGLAAGMDLPVTVMPFILRGVRLIGIDSVMCPTPQRIAAWQQIVSLLPATFYEQASTEIALNDVPQAANDIIKGQITGRMLIKIAD